MRDEERDFFEIMKKFKALNISSILPGISHGDFAVMKEISSRMREQGAEYVRASEVVNSLHIAAPSVSRCFRALEKKHYILRTVDQKDRRNVCVGLTGEGQKILSESEQILNSFADSTFGKMGQEDMKRLNQYLRKFLEASQREIEKRTIKNREET